MTKLYKIYEVVETETGTALEYRGLEETLEEAEARIAMLFYAFSEHKQYIILAVYYSH